MATEPVGYVALVLHTHLPFVLGHGRWPHGSDWLAEVTTGSYLPLLEILASLSDAGLPPQITIDVSPVLAEQLAAPVFKKEIEEFLRARITSARENAADFERQARTDLAAVARWWEEYYRARLAQFEHLGGDLLAEFRRLHDAGAIHLVTCAATHGYLPLLLRDESIELQLRVAAAAHHRHFGTSPTGIWLPECAYRPRYEWTPPIASMRGRVRVRRAGIEEFLARAGLRFFFTDVHLMHGGTPLAAYRDFYPALRALGEASGPIVEQDRTPYRPYEIASRGGTGSAVAFVRDPQSTVQVWSRYSGYPGDGAYLEFHKKHWPGGLRFWRVTSPRSDLGEKQLYVPEDAADRTRAHADHFVSLLRGVLGGYRKRAGRPGLAVSPYDTELFGHWWFEGPQWINEVYHRLRSSQIAPIACADALQRLEPGGPVTLQEGSWGEGGDHRVWLNRDTEWTWERIYQIEDEFWAGVRDSSDDRRPEVRRILAQAARELLLLQASDWQFLITTWAARDYAESRFAEHYANVTRLLQVLRRATTGQAMDRADEEFLAARETQDFLFPDIERHLPAAAGLRS